MEKKAKEAEKEVEKKSKDLKKKAKVRADSTSLCSR